MQRRSAVAGVAARDVQERRCPVTFGNQIMGVSKSCLANLTG
ncbi:MAG: hypothetical protein WCF33_08170 [Pseudonocardiaceae bacterium]